MKKTLPFIILAFASGLADGAQVNEYFSCAVDEYERSGSGSDIERVNCKQQNRHEKCQSRRAEKNILTASGGSYVYEETTDHQDLTISGYFSMSRSTGVFTRTMSARNNSGGSFYSLEKWKGVCVLQKETLKY